MQNVERVPNHANMWSDVATYPKHIYRMKEPNVPMPDAFPRPGQTRHVPDATVTGQLRFKYFKRPVVPFLHSVPAEILLAPVNGEDNVPQTAGNENEAVPAHRTVACQTVYREGETQTDPFTPDYITNPGQDDPEILSLAHLTYGQGLPASLDEINMIHRMREKREFEESLPPITDEASFQLRKKLLEERELKEWAIREEEMKQEQDDKLQILIETLKAREEKSEALSEARVEKVRKQKMKERDMVFEQVNDQRIKAMRGLAKNRPFMETKSNKRDIVGEHAEFGSKVYAPVAREGRLPVKNQVVDYGIPLISNYQGLSALENSIPKSVTEVKVRKPKKIVPKSAQGRKGQQVMADLAYVDALAEAKKHGKKPEKIENVYKKFEPIVRAPTPSVTAPELEEAETAVLLLQRLLRGRAMQNDMYQGKQKALHLIRELRIAEEPPIQHVRLQKEILMDNAIATVQGEVVANTLDFITKELLRVNEQRKISAMVDHANKLRRVREAEESGRRQAEDIVRKKKDQHFKMCMAVHVETAHRFLDDIMDSAVEAYADQIADVQAWQVQVPDTKELAESGQSADEALVQTLVSNFLIPEVDRKIDQRTQIIKDRRHADVAHKAANLMLEEVGRVSKNSWMKKQRKSKKRT